MHERLEFTHREYAQAEYGARLMSDAIVDTWRDVERGTPERPDKFVPFQDSPEVAMEDRWFPGPLSHPYPGVSNCRADKAFDGDPQFPVVGLPDCENAVGRAAEPRRACSAADDPPEPPTVPVDPGISTDDFQARGIPLPENYSAPVLHRARGGRQRPPAGLPAGRHPVHGLLVRAVVRPVAQHQDAHRQGAGQRVHGYDWAARCTYDGDLTATWTCPDPRNPSTNLPADPDPELPAG